MHGKIRVFEQKMKCACPQIWSDAFTSFHVCHSVVYPSPISNISPLTNISAPSPVRSVVAPSSSSSAPFCLPANLYPAHPAPILCVFIPSESVPSSAFVPSPVHSVVYIISSSAPFLSPSKSVPSSTPSSNPVSFHPSESVPSSGLFHP